MKKFFGLLALTLALAVSVRADTRVNVLADQYKLNQATQQALTEARLGDKVVNETVHVLRATYSYAVQGGASTATITLLDVSTGKAAKLPKGAIVRDCIIDTISALTSGAAATVALGSGLSTSDLKTATSYASYTGLVACTPVGSAATAIKMTSDGTISMSVVGGPLLSGKFYLVIHYEMSSTTLP